MWPYWVMFLIPACMALVERQRQASSPLMGEPWVENVADASVPRISLLWWLALVVVALFAGLRHEVGADWTNYEEMFDSAQSGILYGDWWTLDPGYRMLEYIALNAGWGVYGVNLLGATIFSYGLVRFCRSLPRPWLALAVAVPYLVVVVAMGYSRQAVALGCLMVGLVALGHGRVLNFVVWTILAATFHKSALLLLPTAALAASKRRIFTALWVSALVAGAYALLFEDSFNYVAVGYIDIQYASEGALVRLGMNVFPGGLLLTLRHRFGGAASSASLWFWFAIVSVILLGLHFITSSTAVVDRVGLYLLPLQLLVFAHLPEAMGRKDGTVFIWVMVVLGYYATVAFVWLNYAIHAQYWFPYRFYPLVIGV